jgi:putative flippase GtrA
MIPAVFKRPFVRYLLVGGAAFVTEYGLFLIIYYLLHTDIYIANSISFLCGLSVSFTFNRGWAFNSGSFRHKKHHQLAMYTVLALFNLLLTNLLIGLLKKHGLDPKLAKVVVMCLIVVWNFLLFKGLIFRHSSEQA